MISWGFSRRKRLTKHATLNLSKRGASVSYRRGRVTVNSRGHVRVRLPHGLYIRIR